MGANPGEHEPSQPIAVPGVRRSASLNSVNESVGSWTVLGSRNASVRSVCEHPAALDFDSSKPSSLEVGSPRPPLPLILSATPPSGADSDDQEPPTACSCASATGEPCRAVQHQVMTERQRRLHAVRSKFIPLYRAAVPRTGSEGWMEWMGRWWSQMRV